MQSQLIIELLEQHSKKSCKGYRKQYTAHCPAHEDANPSLSISEAADGKILLHCYTGCPIEAICQSLGIKVKDLFNDPSPGSKQCAQKTEHPYHNKDGKIVYRKVRVEPGKGGLTATTRIEGAGGPWRQQYTDALKGAHVVLLYDEDTTGLGRRDDIIMHLHTSVASLKVVALPGLVFTDKHGQNISDWLKAGHTIQELKELVKKAPKYKAAAEAEPAATLNLPQLLVPGGAQSILKAGQVAGGLLKNMHRFFMRGGILVEVVRETDGEPFLEPIKATQFASDIELVAKVVKRGREGMEPTILNSAQAQSMMDSRSFRAEIPEIKMLSKCPILTFAKDRTLRIITGHDKESGILSFASPPEDMSLNAAVNHLLGIFADFNFATPSDRSHAIAALITPDLIFGQLIRARVPLHVIEADESQTCKGFLVKLIAGVHNHKPHAITQRKGGVGGIEESLNMRLIKGDSFISFDNIRDKMDSPALESLLTENHYLARVPYMGLMDIDPKRIVLFLTSNQCEMTKDLTNRSSLIQLRKREEGYPFKTFPEGDVVDHVLANSSRYHGAIITIIKEWIHQGCQETSENRHDFRK